MPTRTEAGPTLAVAGSTPGFLKPLLLASVFGAVLVAAVNTLVLAASVDLGRVRESEPLRSARLVLEDRFDLNPLALFPAVVNEPFELDAAGPFLRFLALDVLVTGAIFLVAATWLAVALALLWRLIPQGTRGRTGPWVWSQAYPLAALVGVSFPAVLLAVRTTLTAGRTAIATVSLVIAAGLWLALLLLTRTPQRVDMLLRRCFGAALAVGGLLLASAGVVVVISPNPTQPPARPGAPNVLLISIDSLRADHLGCYGYARDTSPTIDRLAREGARFRTVVSPTSWTLPAHLTLLTALPPLHHGVTVGSQRLRPEAVLLSETLWEAGYATAGFVSAPYLDAAYGYAQGFDHYDDYSVANRSHEASGRGVTSPRLFGIVSEWLEEWDRGQRQRPFFAFVHMWDVHHDYTPPPPYDALFDPDYRGTVNGENFLGPQVHPGMEARDLAHVIALYDGEIRFTDSFIARIVQQLEELGVADDTVIVITADHGEEFFEHGQKGHRQNLYDETILVPLVIRYPARVPAGVVVTPQVRLMDIAPTILALTGVPRPPDFGAAAGAPHAACDLMPWIAGDPSKSPRPPLTAFSELVGAGRVASIAAVRTQTQKFIQEIGGGQREERYDLTKDPGERFSLAGGDADAALRAELAAWFEAWGKLGALARPVELEPAHHERLRALGYTE